LQHEKDIAMPVAALVIGLLIIVQGVVGLVAPEFFLRLIQSIQTPPIIYFAAVVRIAFGIVLVLAAPLSRAPIALRILGALIVLGGAMTPFFGVRLADIILGWWSQGPGIIRAWATAALVLGVFIVYATGFKRRAA
jgi:hypothetical protein